MPNLTLSFVVTDVDTVETESHQLSGIVLTLSPTTPNNVFSPVVSGEFTGDITLTISGPGPLLSSYARLFKEDQVYMATLGGLPRIDPTALSVEDFEALSLHDGLIEAMQADA